MQLRKCHLTVGRFFVMENCPVILKDKFKLETAIDVFQSVCFCLREGKLLCQKLLLEKKFHFQ